jgi:hypothetical protein
MIRKTCTVLLFVAFLVATSAAAEGATIGGDIGYYQVNANVAGAEVSFNDDDKGTTGEDGTLTVEVYVTGTPYTSYSVAKEGYETFTAEITQYPAKGETVQLQADLMMIPVTQPTAEPTTEPTQSPFPLAGLAGIAAFGVVLLSRKE